MRAVQATIGVALILVGLIVFVCTVDRSAWVLVAVVLVALGAVVLVDLYEVRTPTLADAVEQITRELRGVR